MYISICVYIYISTCTLYPPVIKHIATWFEFRIYAPAWAQEAVGSGSSTIPRAPRQVQGREQGDWRSMIGWDIGLCFFWFQSRRAKCRQYWRNWLSFTSGISSYGGAHKGSTWCLTISDPYLVLTWFMLPRNNLVISTKPYKYHRP